MAGILNIDNNYNINSSKIKGKISFEIGQVFAARIVSLEETGQDILLKLLDGWQFSAKLEKPLELIPEELIKFKVEGFEDGKIKLKIVRQESQGESMEDTSLQKLLKNECLNIKRENYGLLKDMIKHNISLTKENIINIISIESFKENANKDENYIDAFINKYLLSKNINPSSAEGKNVVEKLKIFFNKLTELNSKEIMTFIENNIELSSENIDSFNKIFKEQSASIYNVIKESNISGEDSMPQQGSIYEESTTPQEPVKSSILSLRKDNSSNSVAEQFKGLSKNLVDSIEKDIKLNEIGLKQNDNDNTKSESSLNLNKENVMEAKSENLIIEKDVNIEKKLNESFKYKGIETLAENIKQDIDMKTEEIKNTISSLMKSIKDENILSEEKIAGFLKQHINDFKVFNSVSNQYYYMDVPVNVDNSNYECKLIIKDERKKGKKIDSKSVKIAACINTRNMGEVDAFISVNNANMDINIKSQKEFINLLKDNMNSISQSLINLNYNICITVDKKEEKFDIINCRDFFDDSFLGNVNARV
ncbi:hypothetical protein JOC70_002030 [Clostridium pascui]|uniref:hypothetical protein n=1 Tax=Clostridium pascui TaxID=46609 RepID=UPI001958C21B|nr:hypothetical protein [Clostridium pascui]MBM7870545.1 hypothetical protein [Clostridium pascui]